MKRIDFSFRQLFGSCPRWVAGAVWVAALASGCNDGTDGQSFEGASSADDTLEQIVVSTRADAGAGAGGWCAVQQISQRACVPCHDGQGTAGAPMGLVTYADFLAKAPLSPGKKVYEAVFNRVHDSVRPMPPRGPLPAAELKIIDDWVDAGAPSGAPDGGVPKCPDAGRTVL